VTPLKRSFRAWVVIAVLLAGLVVTHAFWMPAVGTVLDGSEQPGRADIVVVLAGDYEGRRILKAASLVREGFAPTALVSGPDGFYGFRESELAIPFAVRHGYPSSWFTPLLNSSRSTREEAQAIVPELRKRGVRTCLIVTSDYHTRRAGYIYRSLAPKIEFRVVSADSQVFDLRRWWHTREGRKIVFLEWTKLFADRLGI
jgi:uncharacterized SAM-binding protein YcdF (DUF218 family)